MKHLFVLILLYLACSVNSQNVPKEYQILVKQADSLYAIKDYKNSALTYNKAFLTIERKALPTDRYNAACSWAMAGYADSAFYNLTSVVARANYSNYRHIISDSDLMSLHSDARWPGLISRVKANKDKSNQKYNVSLINLIDSMVTEDQKWRGLSRMAHNNEVDTTLYTRRFIFEKIHLVDSLNYSICRKIVNNYGFPNYQLVGTEASNDFWLLVQHQDQHVGFQDTVLSKMKVEVDKKLASGSNYAYLIDRVKVNTQQAQIYGTQMRLNKDKTSYEPEDTIEPEKLNERRRSVGLGTIEEYTRTMNERYYGTLKK